MLPASLLFLIIIFGSSSYASIIFRCPPDTTCTRDGQLTAKSFKFLNEIDEKYARLIYKLTVTNASIDKIPTKIKYLKNLTYLNLSHNKVVKLGPLSLLTRLKLLNLSYNHLRDINDIVVLPDSIEVLDLSNNRLKNIPRTVPSSLEVLALGRNPIDCDCSNTNVLSYKKLIEDGLEIVQNVMCDYTNQDINTVNCTLSDIMLYDEAMEGSGSGEANNNDIFSEVDSKTIPIMQEQEQDANNDKDDLAQFKEVLPDEDDDLITTSNNNRSIVPEEGSGDGGEALEEEGSGIDLLEIPMIPACHINCATPAPIGLNDENDTSPLPGPKDQLKIVAEDVIRPIFPNPFMPVTTELPSSTISTTSTTTATTTTTTTSAPIEPEEVSEEILVKEVDTKQENSDNVEVFLNATRTGEMEKATAAQASNYTLFGVIASCLLLAVVFLICFIQKRKSNQLKRERHRHAAVSASQLEKEMQPIDQIRAAQKANEKNGNMVNATPAEQVPLIINGGGQNGKATKDADPVTETYTPLEHPEILTESEFEDLRGFLQPPNRGEKVTVRASDNPDSIPKSPILVHRQVDGNGDVVTTVVSIPEK